MGIYPQSDQLTYRQILGGLMEAKGEIRSRKPQPEVVVKLDLAEGEAEIIKGLLGNPNLEFKVSAIDSANGVTINMHIRLKQPKE